MGQTEYRIMIFEDPTMNKPKESGLFLHTGLALKNLFFHYLFTVDYIITVGYIIIPPITKPGASWSRLGSG
jgi:hypothetical protein